MPSPLEQAIRDLASFLPQGRQLPMDQFDLALQQQLEAIEKSSHQNYGLRDMYRKLCFDLCGYELDSSFILRRLRYKPLGYAGDFEAMDKLYLGTGTTFWDAFLQHQEAVKSFQEFDIQEMSPLLFLCPVYRLLQTITSEVSIVAYEPQAVQFAKSFAPLRVYDSLDSIDQSFKLIYAPYVLHRIHPEQLSQMVKYLWQKLEPKGKMVFYQLRSEHGLRWFIEWCLDWSMYYHDEKILKKLAQEVKAEFTLELKGEWWQLELRKT
jgi:hypothetical protein